MEKKFNIGDLVVLRSGSVTMTVENNIETADLITGQKKFYGKVKCKWFSDGKFHIEEFTQDSLELENNENF